jgi:hypothetical protein
LNSKLIITIATLILILSGTYLAIQWAKGYRLNLNNQTLQGNGLLVANSSPQGASVYIDNQLTTATDDTIHLNPGTYQVKLEKEGYATWQKQLTIEKELVTQTNTQLFPSVPNPTALTVNSAQNPLPSPDGHKIAYTIATDSAKTKKGVWVLNLNDNPLNFGSNSTQIIQDTPSLEFSKAQLFWTPNSNQIIAYFNENQIYILETNKQNQPTQLINSSFQMDNLISDWQQQLWLEKQQKIEQLPIEMQQIATQSATLTFFSPNEEKLLYTATTSATIPEQLIPPIPASNTQPQQRQLTSGNIYVYDIEEDKNFLIKPNTFTPKELQTIIQNFYLEKVEKSTNTPIPQLASQQTKKDPTTILNRLQKITYHYSPIYSAKLPQWFPTSNHLVYSDDNKITISEYDNTNHTNIYSGPFEESFSYPWPNGDKMVILTSFTYDHSQPANLYGFNLK